MNFVGDSWRLKGEDLGRFMRNHGISCPELDSWKEQMKAGLDMNKPFGRSERAEYQLKIKQLEKKLQHAELLLEFQKKAKEMRLVRVVESSKKRSAKTSKVSSSAGKKKG
jgi:hypothetical protein